MNDRRELLRGAARSAGMNRLAFGKEASCHWNERKAKLK